MYLTFNLSITGFEMTTFIYLFIQQFIYWPSICRMHCGFSRNKRDLVPALRG